MLAHGCALTPRHSREDLGGGSTGANPWVDDTSPSFQDALSVWDRGACSWQGPGICWPLTLNHLPPQWGRSRRGSWTQPSYDARREIEEILKRVCDCNCERKTCRLLSDVQLLCSVKDGEDINVKSLALPVTSCKSIYSSGKLLMIFH